MFSLLRNSDANFALEDNEIGYLPPFIKISTTVKTCCPLYIPPHFTMCLCRAYASPWAPRRTIYRDESSGIFSHLLLDSRCQIFLPVGLCTFYMTSFTCVSVWSSLFSLQEVSCSLILHFKRLRKETSKKSQILENNISPAQWWLIFITSTGFSSFALYIVFFNPFQFSLN